MALAVHPEQPGLLQSNLGGSGGGSPFNHLQTLRSAGFPEALHARIRWLQLDWDDGQVHRVRTTYGEGESAASVSTGASYLRHGAVPRTQTFSTQLAVNEVVTRVGVSRGAHNPRWQPHGAWLRSMSVVIRNTAAGADRVINAGPHDINQHEYQFSAGPGFCISHIYGRSGHYIDAVGLYFSAAVPRTWSRTVRQQYPADFQAAVDAFLQATEDRLPADLQFAIVQALNTSCYYAFTSMEAAGFTPPPAGAAVPLGFNILGPPAAAPPAAGPPAPAPAQELDMALLVEADWAAILELLAEGVDGVE